MRQLGHSSLNNWHVHSNQVGPILSSTIKRVQIRSLAEKKHVHVLHRWYPIGANMFSGIFRR